MFKKIIIAVGKFLLLPFSIAFLLQKMEKMATKANGKMTPNVCAFFSSTARREICSRELFEESIEMPFEQYYFKVPKRYDEYLKQQYGDYMQLPPVEQQVPHHVFKAWWK